MHNSQYTALHPHEASQIDLERLSEPLVEAPLIATSPLFCREHPGPWLFLVALADSESPITPENRMATNNHDNSCPPTSPSPSSHSVSNTSQRQVDALSPSGRISSPRSVIAQSNRTTRPCESPKLEPSPISPRAADPAHQAPDEQPPSASPAANTRSSSRFPSAASYFSQQPGASDLQSPKLTHRRPKGPPASRSSRGINNIAGPPPTLSTQRVSSSLTTAEDSRRASLAYEYRGTPPRLTPQNLASLDAVTSQVGKVDGSVASGIDSSYHEAANREIGGVGNTARESTFNSFDTVMLATTIRASRKSRGEYYEGDEDDLLRRIGVGTTTSAAAPMERPRLGERAGTVGQSQEDLFLALANADNSSVALANGSETREKNERSSRANGYKRRSLIYDNKTTFDSGSVDHASDEPYQFGSSTFDMPIARNERRYASSAHPLEQRKKARLSGGAPRSSLYAPREVAHGLTSPELPRIYDRRISAQGTVSEVASRRFRHPTPQYYSSPLTGRPRTRDDYERASMVGSRTGATESTVSTNAPSAVWDELEDIKTRIQHLELTTVLPSSSRASMSLVAGDRPVTANTTVTTASTSPKRTAPRETPSSQTPTYGEPLRDSAAAAALASALEQAKPDLSPGMYRSMEVAVNNSVAIANMSTTAGRQQPLSNVTERQLRRKADKLCRSLTDVCIALSKERMEWNGRNSRPESVDHDVLISSRPGSAYHDAIEIHSSDAADETSPTFERGRSPESRISLGEGSNVMKLSEAEFLNRMDPEQYPLANGSTANHAIERFTSQSQHHASSPLPNPNVQISRSSTVLQRTRPYSSEIASDQPRPPPLRPLSRAVTDYNFSRAQKPRESSVQRHPPAAQASPLHRPPSSLLAFPAYNEQYTPSVKSSSIPYRPTSVIGSSPMPFTPPLRYQEKAVTPSSSESKRGRLEELKARIARHG